jgi:hypothetical protein
MQNMDPQHGPGEAERRELARLRAEFAGHRIVREAQDHGAGVRYCAYGVTITVQPHTIITSDLGELRAELKRSDEQ